MAHTLFEDNEPKGSQATLFESKLRARRGGITSHIAGEVRISYEERDAVADAIEALRRIADPTEMAGLGPTEEMTGPGAREMRCRMKTAEAALARLDNL